MTSLQKIYGTSGRKECKKIITGITHKIIAPEFISKITWSGRSGIKGVKKIRLDKYENIVQLICDVCMAADRTADEEKVYHELKYTALKYAHAREKKSSSSSTATVSDASQPQTPETQTPIIPIESGQSISNVQSSSSSSSVQHHTQQQQPSSHLQSYQFAYPYQHQQMHQQQHTGLYHNNQFGEGYSQQQLSHQKPITPASEQLSSYYHHPPTVASNPAPSTSAHVHTIDSYDAPNWSFSLHKL